MAAVDAAALSQEIALVAAELGTTILKPNLQRQQHDTVNIDDNVSIDAAQSLQLVSAQQYPRKLRIRL